MPKKNKEEKSIVKNAATRAALKFECISCLRKTYTTLLHELDSNGVQREKTSNMDVDDGTNDASLE